VKNGFFITIEGLDGAGKSTQIQLMKKFFERKGFKVFLTREPGGTKIGEKIREIILDTNHKEMVDTTEALLYAASRAQHVSQVILPALKRGEIVLCDRFVDSSMVYQGRGRNLGFDQIKKINDFATQNLEPDLTILFDIDPVISLDRIGVNENGDRLEQEKIDFHYSVYKGYLDLSVMYPQRIKIVRANRSIEDVQQDIQNILMALLKEENL
jgi:dTMP kinase